MLTTVTLIWVISVAVQYTKIICCPDVCTMPRYVPSHLCTAPTFVLVPSSWAYELSRHMYRLGVCTVPTYVLSRQMYRPDICTVLTYVGRLAVTG